MRRLTRCRLRNSAVPCLTIFCQPARPMRKTNARLKVQMHQLGLNHSLEMLIRGKTLAARFVAESPVPHLRPLDTRCHWKVYFLFHPDVLLTQEMNSGRRVARLTTKSKGPGASCAFARREHFSVRSDRPSPERRVPFPTLSTRRKFASG